MPSLTEKDVEFWLEPEPRLIPAAGGRLTKFTGTRLMWSTLDRIVSFAYEAEWARETFTLENIIKLARSEAEITGMPFAIAFENLVGYIATQIREKIDNTF